MKSPNSKPFEQLLSQMESNNQGMIILCASTRAAALLKRMLLGKLPGGALLNIDILAPNELIAQLTRQLGIEARVIGGLGREMVLNEVLANMKKKPFKGAEMRDYVRSIGKAIGELIQANVTESELTSSSLGNDKTELLAVAYSAYLKRLRSSGAIDAKELPDKVFEKIGQSGLPQSLTCRSIVKYCVPIDTLADKLVKSLEIEGIVVQRIDEEEDNEYHFKTVHSIYAREGRQLAREVARRCKELVSEFGCGYQDICIMVPPVQGAEREVVKALEWAGIPSSDPLWVNLSEHPSASSLISAMRLIALSSEKVDIFPYCASPYYGLDYFIRGKVSRNMYATGTTTAIVSKVLARQRQKSEPLYLTEWADVQKLNKHFRKINDEDSDMDSIMADFYKWTGLMLEIARKFSVPNTWDGHCDNLENFIKDFYADNALLSREEDDPGRAAIEQKAISGINDVISKVRSAYTLTKGTGGRVDWVEFSATIADAFKEKRLMLRGASRSGVGVAEPKDILGLRFKHLIIYDVSERNFPLPWNPGWLLSDRDRKSIKAFREQTAENKNAVLKAHFFCAVSNTDESVCFTIPSIGTDEKAINRSIWVTDIEEECRTAGMAVTEEHIKRRYPAPEVVDCSVTENEVVLHRADELTAKVGEGKSLADLFEANSRDSERIARLACDKFREEYRWSASMIGQFLKCSMAFVPTYLAGIRQKDEYEELPSPMSAGNFLHSMVKMVIDKVDELRGLPYPDASAKLDQFIKLELGYDRARLAVNMSEELWGILKVPHARIIKRFAESELEYLQTNGACFGKRLTEQKFSTGDNSGKLQLHSIDISYEARIDRIDIDESNNAAVYDYKSGTLPEREQDVQVDFYSLIVRQELGTLPIASAYFPLSRSKGCTRAEISLGSYVDEFHEQLGFKQPRSNNTSLIHYPKDQVESRLADASFSIEGLVNEILSGAYFERKPANSNPCKYCIKNNICWLFANM